MQSLPSRKRRRDGSKKDVDGHSNATARSPLSPVANAVARQNGLDPASSSADTGDNAKNDQKTAGNPRLKQAVLAFGQRSTHITCKECGMQYNKIDAEDRGLHLQYCSSVQRGLIWRVKPHERDIHESLSPLQLRDHRRNASACIQRIAYQEADERTRKKLARIRDMVDIELQAVSSTEEELFSSTYYLFMLDTSSSVRASRIHRDLQVVGVAIVRKIRHAYQILPEDMAPENSSYLRFGESEGALYCSPDPVSATVGIDRIWTSSSHRGLGVATALLDRIAASAIYGTQLLAKDRAKHFAFSQPTSQGARLFAHWTGTKSFLIFVDE